MNEEDEYIFCFKYTRDFEHVDVRKRHSHTLYSSYLYYNLHSVRSILWVDASE